MLGLAIKGHTSPDTGPDLPPICHFLGCFWCQCFIFCSFSPLLQCMMDHEIVVRELYVQVHAHVNTAETDWNSCHKQNKLLLCSILKKGKVSK